MSNKESKERIANAFRAMKAIGISEDKVKPVLKNLLKLYDKNWALIEEDNYRALADAVMSNTDVRAKDGKTRVANAFHAMKAIGIPEDKVKPVLKNLLKLYDKNWVLIEEENYRALADAIFESEEAEAQDCSKKTVNNEAAGHSKKPVNSEKENHLEEEAQATEEPERPLKRLRLKYRDAQTSSSNPSNSRVPKMPLVKPKEEPNELPETSPPKRNAPQGIVESPQPNTRNTMVVNSEGVPCKNKGKRPMSPRSLVAHEVNTPLVNESRSPSSMRLRDRGKGSLSPQIPSLEKKSVPNSSSRALCIKEPQKGTSTHALIVPKDEPITDDIPCLQAPLAVVHPDPSNKGDSSSMNGTVIQHHVLKPSVPPVIERGTDGVTPTPNEPQNNGELAMILGESSSNLEIASSPFGEVKISLSYDLANRSPDFHMPSLETLLKSVEDKCLRSYKTLDTNFSMLNLMKEMCQSFLELGSDSNSESQEAINVNPTVDPTETLLLPPPVDGVDDDPNLKKMNGGDDLETNGENCTEETNNMSLMVETLLLPHPFNGADDDTHLKKMDDGDYPEADGENEENCAQETNNMSLVVVKQPDVTPEIIKPLHYVVDIAKGQEKLVITLVNEVNNESPPSFYYIPQNAIFRNAYVNFSLARIGDKGCCSTCVGDCLSLSTPCVCGHKSGGEFAYTTDGLVKEEFLKECISTNRDPNKHCQFFCKECPLERSKSQDIVESCKGHSVRKFIKECWWKCGCNKQCGNRVVQRGITRNLQVFMTGEGKGWGLRTLEDLPEGAFVCEYVGEVLTNAELFDRVLRSPKRKRHSYPVLLDADWGAKGWVLKDEKALCLDAAYFGNVARFINHRCYDSNLVEIPVEVETPDRHYYHVALFTTRKVKVMEELTWDYGIDFDDLDHPIKAFSCQCGSKFCRNIKRSRSRAIGR
ncbi:hypothetical protein BUALT_Bualt13G0025100 [Buddleja alternifolia]|uniref:Uncharacterized protein n=1 Tax=Buddleja alternifolia TaxID=168488 RepID=A0AAV6WL80_9LAMI|nr:hypothetical protein BUALT_Bualt13G0025100 [Buddleja alternifolia]